MKLSELLDHLEELTEEQLNMDFVVSFNDHWVCPTMITVVKKDHGEDSEAFPENQPIFI